MSQNAITVGKQAGVFIPEFWSTLLNKKLEKSGVGMKIVNKRYEGEITKAGDTVHIQESPTITINTYDASTDISYEDPDGTTQELIIDQEKYFAFRVDDISKAQANVKIADKFMENAKVAIDLVKDSFILGKYADIDAGNIIPAVTLTPSNAYKVFVDLAKTLKNSNAIQSNDDDVYHSSDRTGDVAPWVVINPDVEAVLLQSPEFIHPTQAGDKVLRAGSIGMIAGLDVLVSTNLPTTGGVVNVMAGINDAITFAAQITKVETLRSENSFKDLVRGLYVYGAKTVLPKALAGCAMTVA